MSYRSSPLYVYLSNSPSSLSVCPAVYMLLTTLNIGRADRLLVCQYASQCVCLPICLKLLNPSVHRPACPPACLSCLSVCPVRLSDRSTGPLSVCLLSKRFSPFLHMFLCFCLTVISLSIRSSVFLMERLSVYELFLTHLFTCTSDFHHLSVFWLSFTCVCLSVCPHTSYSVYLLTDSSSPNSLSQRLPIHLFIVYPSVFPSGCHLFLFAASSNTFLTAYVSICDWPLLLVQSPESKKSVCLVCLVVCKCLHIEHGLFIYRTCVY